MHGSQEFDTRREEQAFLENAHLIVRPWQAFGLLRRIAVSAAAASAAQCALAQSALIPSSVFVQGGTGADTRQVVVGVAWDWSKQWAFAGGRLGGFWEMSLSGWSYHSMDGRRTDWLGQVGAVPTFRYRPNDGDSPWFAELGVGASFTTTLYKTQRKRFSTRFNFADHIGVGRSFGANRQHEIALRLEHFSNAGIKHPNPGENFVALRYSLQLQ